MQYIFSIIFIFSFHNKTPQIAKLLRKYTDTISIEKYI